MKWANENAFDAPISAASATYGVPATLIKAVIGQESRFNPLALRKEAPRASLPPTPDFPAGGDESRGLMQLLVRTARALGYQGPPDGLYEPGLNIQLGARLLAENLRRAGGRIDVALSAYNGGWSTVRPTDGKRVSNTLPSPFINQAYVDRVLAFKNYFDNPPPQAVTAPAGAALLPFSFGAGGVYFVPSVLTLLLVGLLVAALVSSAGNGRAVRQ